MTIIMNSDPKKVRIYALNSQHLLIINTFILHFLNSAYISFWQRTIIFEILEEKWFRKEYKSLTFEKHEGNIDGIIAAFVK